MDVVIPVGPDCGPELRYCLRSIAAHLPHERVWLIGDIPAWVHRVERAVVPQARSKYANTQENLRTACEHPDISDPFALFNDDFFVMKPITEIPTLHAGYLTDHYSQVHSRVGKTQYARAMLQARTILELRGIVDPLSYALHVPMVVDKAGFLAAIALAADSPKLSKRTLYGNLAGIGGDPARDVKVSTRNGPIPDGPFLSTSDRAFGLYPVGRMIRSTFPDECAYERPAPTPVPRGGRSRSKSTTRRIEVTTSGDC
jgi:hypothetical protein